MTLILVNTNFEAFDVNPKNGKLDKAEVSAAHEKGCVWAKEGQTAIEYIAARTQYYESKKEASWKTLTETRNYSLDSIFTKFNSQKKVDHHIL